MGEIARWALLGVAIVALVALVLSLPIFQNIPGTIGEMSRAVDDILTYVGSFFVEARGLANLFVYPGTEWLLTIVISWQIIRPFRQQLVTLSLTVYHWIFK